MGQVITSRKTSAPAGTFEPANAPRMEDHPDRGSPAASNALGSRMHMLPEFEHADERLAVAKADLDEVTARQSAVLAAVSTARDQSNAAIRKRATEIEALALAKREFGAALAAGQDTGEVELRVTGAQMRIDALTSISESSLKEAQRLEASASSFHSQMDNASKRFKDAELMVLIKQYAALLPPLIVLAKEISRRDNAMTLHPGYLLDIRHPKIGHYNVADDGSMSFQLGA